MPDNNLPADAGPVDDTPLTYSQQVEGISDLIEDPTVLDPQEPVEDQATADEAEAPEGEEAGSEDVENTEGEEPDDGPQDEIKGGRFAPDTAKTTLDDGTVITVAELKRNNLFQRDYTKKTTEHAEAVKAFEAQKSEVDQYAQSLSQSRDYLAWYAENFLPKKPQPFQGDPGSDPVGYNSYLYQKEQWQQHAEAYQAFQAMKKAEGEKQAGETRAQQQDRIKREMLALVEAVPTLKDPAKAKSITEYWTNGAREHYGFTPEEVNSIGDHRMYLVLRDALELKRLKAKAPQAQAEVAAKPAMKGGKRAAPDARQSKDRHARSEQLRKTGSFDLGVKALMDLDL